MTDDALRLSSYNSDLAPQPIGGYVQAVGVEGGRRLLFISGQVPVDATGRTPEDFEGQCRLVWRNLEAQLHAADMSMDNLIKVTTYLADRRHGEANGSIRREALGKRTPALTVVLAGIFDESWLLEIEAVAAD